MGGKEALAEKGGVDAARVVAFAYDTYTNPSKNNGVLCATQTKQADYWMLQEFGRIKPPSHREQEGGIFVWGEYPA